MNEHRFQIDLRGMIDLLANHLYSSPTVFVRELLQTAVDAITARTRLDPAHLGEIQIELTPGRGDAPPTLLFSDNGIGLTTSLKHTWLVDLDSCAGTGERPRRPLTILTGKLAAQAFARELGPALAATGTPPVEVIGVANEFYGHTVTVAGLLSGRDLRRALSALPANPPRTVALSPRVLNTDGLTLDDLTLAEIAADQPHEVVVPPEEGFIDFWTRLD